MPATNGMSIGEGIDRSPLLANGESQALNLNGRSFEQDAASVSTVTLTNFHEASPGVVDPRGPSPWRRPVLSARSYFSRLASVFSWRFLSWVAVQQFSLGGGLMTLTWSISLPLFKGLGIDASRQQVYTTMMLTPYALKPFIGVTSDLFPIGGYHKKHLALSSIAIGLAGCSALLGLFHSGAASGAASRDPIAVQHLADLITVCFFAMNFEGATLEILGDGKFAEIMRGHPESGSSAISFTFIWSLLGMVVTQCYVGPMADAGYFGALFWIASVLMLAPAYPTLRGWIPEKKVTKEDAGVASLCPGVLFNRRAFQRRRTPFVAIALSGLAAPVMSAVSTYSDLGIGLVSSGFVILALLATTYAVFPRKFFRMTLGNMLFVLCRIRMTSGLNYFYTANSTCLPDGPQFSYTFYITLTGIIGSVIHLVAITLYQAFMSSWRFRPALVFTMVVGALATIVDLIIIMRWNVSVGIPDKVFFLMGNSVGENLANMLHVILMSTIFAKMSPPGMESAVYAYSVGIQFFCYLVSNLLGSAIIKWSGMKTVGEDCNFDDLPRLVVIFQILVPLLVGIPATLLIPNVRQTEQLIEWEKERWYEDGQEQTEQTVVFEEVEAMDGESFDLQAEHPHSG